MLKIVIITDKIVLAFKRQEVAPWKKKKSDVRDPQEDA